MNLIRVGGRESLSSVPACASYKKQQNIIYQAVKKNVLATYILI